MERCLRLGLVVSMAREGEGMNHYPGPFSSKVCNCGQAWPCAQAYEKFLPIAAGKGPIPTAAEVALAKRIDDLERRLVATEAELHRITGQPVGTFK